MPALLKLNLDGTYLGHVESLYKQLKHLSLVTRSQLLKNNDNMEYEEYKEKVESLKCLTEAYKMIALGEDPDSGSEENEEDDY